MLIPFFYGLLHLLSVWLFEQLAADTANDIYGPVVFHIGPKCRWFASYWKHLEKRAIVEMKATRYSQKYSLSTATRSRDI
jgi:hypothetical protein